VLTKDNLVRRNWKGSQLCVFCTNPESIQHLFFDCDFAKFLWRAVQVTFNIGIPTSVVQSVQWLGQWSRNAIKKVCSNRYFCSLLGIVDKYE
jgi:hypothetical protein